MSTGDAGACVYLEYDPAAKVVRPCGHLGSRFQRPKDSGVVFKPVHLERATWTGLPVLSESGRIIYLCPEHRAFVEDVLEPLPAVDNPRSLLEEV